MGYKKNESLFFDVMKNVQIFSSETGHFEDDHRLLFSREIAKIRSCKKVRLRRLAKFRLPG